ncbi:TPA: CidA/LrgA family protein [Photobacterium damselae]
MNYLRSFAIVMICYFLGQGIQYLTHLPISGSIIGLFILFTALCLGVCPTSWVESTCNLLIKHMALLFVPVGVGLMNYLDLISNNVAVIAASTFGSTFIVLVVLGLAVHHKEKDK